MKILYSDWNLLVPREQRNGIYEVEDYATFYFVNGKFHREDGPAVEDICGNKYWYINGKRHRLDGPAYENNEGNVEYWIKGKRYYTKEEFEKDAYMYKNGLQDYL